MQFVERCAGSDAATAAADFLETIRRMGFSCAACGAWAGIGRHRQNRFFFVDWPADWLDFYQNNGFVEHDILPIEARRRVRPFWYSEAISRLKLSAKQKELYEGGRRLRLDGRLRRSDPRSGQPARPGDDGGAAGAETQPCRLRRSGSDGARGVGTLSYRRRFWHVRRAPGAA
ncbi:MAG: autoinducer binding domain-containing protein [Xanthobacteraceae bacterium]